MLKSSLKVALLIVALVSIFFVPCEAQYRIPMDSVEKFIFVRKGSFMNRSYVRIDVLPERSEWKAYQTRLQSGFSGPAVNDSTKKFLKVIARKDLSDLLKLIARTDTGINPALLKIDKKRVLDQFDTLVPFLKPRQRALIAKKIYSGRFLDSMITGEVRRSVISDDPNYYGIYIKTKGGKTYQLSAYANEQIYAHLPWTVGNLKTFDPRISAIFDKIVDNSYYAYSLDRFYSNIVFWSFLNFFRKIQVLDDLKEDYPATYQSLIASFKPIVIADNNHIYKKARRPKDSLIYSGGFQAAGLPQYVNLHFSFKPTDTAVLNLERRYVDTIKGFFNIPSLIFNQLKNIPGAKLSIDQYLMKQQGDFIFKSFEKNFPGIRKYGYRQANVLYVTGTDALKSVWILLPDNTLILCKYLYRGPKPKLEDAHFMGLDNEVIRRHLEKSYAVCIHVDASGKLIHDYGELEHLDLTRDF